MAASKRWVTMAEYARRRGVSRAAVSNAFREGRIQLVRGLIDLDQADREWEANSVPTGKPEAAAAEKGPSWNSVRTLVALRRADLLAIERDRKRGELVPAAEVQLAIFEWQRRIRDRLFSVPGQKSGDLHAAKTQRDLERVLLDELRSICEQLVNEPPIPPPADLAEQLLFKILDADRAEQLLLEIIERKSKGA